MATPPRDSFARLFPFAMLAIGVVAIAIWVVAGLKLKAIAEANAARDAAFSAEPERRVLSLDDRLTIANACARLETSSDAEALRKCKKTQLELATSMATLGLDGAPSELVEAARRACGVYSTRGDLRGHRECFKATLSARKM